MTTYRKHKEALARLKRALQGPAVFVHYSCESFTDYSKPGSRRVTSIAVRFGDNSQTKSFSIHQVAEKRGWLQEISSKLDACEKQMLVEFYEFVREHKAFTWMHWNMRDSNYGFEAIAHRFEVLGGTPISISDDKKLDLSPLLIDIYGKKYTGHPRIEWLVKKNDIFRKTFLTGQEEADAFVAGNFVALHQSTLVKVQALADIADLTSTRQLKTQSSVWKDVYSSSISSFGEALVAHWVFILTVSVIGIILAIIPMFGS